jgi:hypothetical protein
VLPYKIAFIDEESDFDVVSDSVFNILLAIDMIVCFFSAYIDNEDNIIKNRRKIISQYLSSWFLIDFVSIIPISYLTENNGGRINTLARLTRIPKLYRLIRLTKYKYFYLDCFGC